MAKRNGDPISLSEVLQSFVASNSKIKKGIDSVDVSKAWFDLNPAFETYTTTIRLDRETLIVGISSSVFRQELSFGKAKIIERLNDSLGRDLIKKIILA